MAMNLLGIFSQTHVALYGHDENHPPLPTVSSSSLVDSSSSSSSSSFSMELGSPEFPSSSSTFFSPNSTCSSFSPAMEHSYSSPPSPELIRSNFKMVLSEHNQLSYTSSSPAYVLAPQSGFFEQIAPPKNVQPFNGNLPILRRANYQFIPSMGFPLSHSNGPSAPSSQGDKRIFGCKLGPNFPYILKHHGGNGVPLSVVAQMANHNGRSRHSSNSSMLSSTSSSSPLSSPSSSHLSASQSSTESCSSGDDPQFGGAGEDLVYVDQVGRESHNDNSINFANYYGNNNSNSSKENFKQAKRPYQRREPKVATANKQEKPPKPARQPKKQVKNPCQVKFNCLVADCDYGALRAGYVTRHILKDHPGFDFSRVDAETRAVYKIKDALLK